MRRLTGVVLGLLIGWAIGTAALLAVSAVLVGIGVRPTDQLASIGLAMFVLVLAGGALGFRLAKPGPPGSQ